MCRGVFPRASASLRGQRGFQRGGICRGRPSCLGGGGLIQSNTHIKSSAAQLYHTAALSVAMLEVARLNLNIKHRGRIYIIDSLWFATHRAYANTASQQAFQGWGC